MRLNNLPDYPRIELSDLDKLKPDSESARRFERRFSPAFMGGVILAFGGMIVCATLHHFAIIADWRFALWFIVSLASGFFIIIWAHRRMMRTRPYSPRTGHPMEPFIIRDLEAQGYYELAYIDQKSGTYFRRRYVEPGAP